MTSQPRIGLAALTHMAFQGIDQSSLRLKLLQESVFGKAKAGALMDLSVIDQIGGTPDQAMIWQSKALETCRFYQTERTHTGARKTSAKKLLVFAEPTDIGSNTPVEFLLRSSSFDITTFYLMADRVEQDFPMLSEYDVAFCAAPADTTRSKAFFAAARALAQHADLPMVNAPDTLVNIDRDGLADLLSGIENLRVPSAGRMERAALLAPAITCGQGQAAPQFPIILRPVGSHAGRGLARITSHQELKDYLSTRYETDFFISPFIDYASADDAQFRKYRIVFVDGRPFPCHMAIGDHWDLWYLNAGMSEQSWKRIEEAQFMDAFETDFARTHAQALSQIADRIGLDYFGIDCAEDRDGDLVLFEADNALIVHDMDCTEGFAYKAAPTQRIFKAFEAMLDRVAAEGPPSQKARFSLAQTAVPIHNLS